MNLSLVIFGPLDRRSGGYSYDTDLVGYCRDRGHHVDVWSLPERPRQARQALTEKLGREEPDLVIFDALTHAAILPVLETHRVKKGVWLALVHHLAWQERPGTRGQRALQARERRFLTMMDGVVANSEHTRGAVKDLLGTDRFLPSVICRPPVRPAPPRVPGPGGARLLFVGNLIPRKNLHGLLQGLALLVRKRPELHWSLTVAGSAEWDPSYARRCRRLASPLAGRVAWVGRVSDDELQELWARTDLLTVPSFHEGWGMVHAEALVRGIPALAVPEGASPEVLGNAGLWSGHDPQSLAATLEAFFDDAALRDDLCRKAVLRSSLSSKRPRFEGLEAFCQSLIGVPEAGRSEREFDFSAYLAAKAGVDSRSLHPRVLDSAFSAPISQVVDLGGGTGTMAERLRSWARIGPDVSYELVDLSADGLAIAEKHCSPLFSKGKFKTTKDDLLAYCDAHAGSKPDLVIAHAVLDLFDAETAAQALARLEARQYWLTHLFDGLTAWEPVLDPELDRSLAEAYHRSMAERGRGEEGGPRSGRDWLAALPRAGFRVVDCGASDWIVRPDGGRYQDNEPVFLASMLHFFRTSLTGRSDVDQAGLRWWLAMRQTQVASAAVSLVVHQLDVSAVWQG